MLADNVFVSLQLEIQSVCGHEDKTFTLSERTTRQVAETDRSDFP